MISKIDENIEEQTTLKREIEHLDNTMADFAKKYENLSTKYNIAMDEVSAR